MTTLDLLKSKLRKDHLFFENYSNTHFFVLKKDLKEKYTIKIENKYDVFFYKFPGMNLNQLSISRHLDTLEDPIWHIEKLGNNKV